MIESVIDVDADLADWIEQRQAVPSAEEDYSHQGISRTWSADLWVTAIDSHAAGAQ